MSTGNRTINKENDYKIIVMKFVHIVHWKIVYVCAMILDKRGEYSMIHYKQGINVLDMLKNTGYTTYRIARENILGQSTLQKFRTGKLPSWNELDKLCKLLNCGPWDIIDYSPDQTTDE